MTNNLEGDIIYTSSKLKYTDNSKQIL